MFDTGAKGEVEAIVAALSSHARAEAVACAAKLAAAAELSRIRSAELAADWLGAANAPSPAASEVAVAWHVAMPTAQILIHLGERLRDDLPALGRAFARGDLDFLRVRAVAGRLAEVTDPVVLAELQERVLAALLDRGRVITVGQVHRLVDHLVATLDPESLRVRRERAVEDRDIRVRADVDGMATLIGWLPAPDGVIVDQQLRAMSMQVCPNDPRTQAQRRADALTALTHGNTLRCQCPDPRCTGTDEDQDGDDDADAAHDGSDGEDDGDVVGDGMTAAPRRHRCRPELRIVVNAETLLGASELPGVLAGIGVIDADTVRRIAANATWRRLLTVDGDPVRLSRRHEPGEVPDAAALRYQPSERLAALVRARDGHCRFPGCLVPADGCDLDHRIPFNHHNPTAGGWTTADNLHALCRSHHRLKTHGEWRSTAGEGNAVHWHGPAGQQIVTHPDGLPPPPTEVRDTLQRSRPTPLDLEGIGRGLTTRERRIESGQPRPPTPQSENDAPPF